MLSNTRKYFRQIMDALNYKEHPDAFNDTNIGSSVLDRSYHVSYLSFNGIDKAQDTQAADVGIAVQVFFKGFTMAANRMDEAMDLAEVIIGQAVSPERVFNNNLDITGCVFDSMVVEELDATNQKSLVVNIGFLVRVNFCLND